MPAEVKTGSLLSRTRRVYGTSWKSLILTDLIFKAFAFIVLTPLAGLLFRTLIAVSGKAVLSDLDILFFLLGPAGWLCGILVGAFWLAIVALEQTSLLGIICAENAGKKLQPIVALRFAASHAWPVLRVTIRIVAWTLLSVVPFLAVAGAVYFALLTKYDLNYYLQEKPPEFLVAVTIGIVLVVVLVALLLRLVTSWFFALPLVLLEDVNPRVALKLSATRAHGHRRTLVGWIVGWAAVMTALSTLATGVVGWVGRLLTPDSTESLHLLVVSVGVTLLLWALVNLVVNLLSTTTFAAILFNLYRELGRDGVHGALEAGGASEAMMPAEVRVTQKRLLAAGVAGIVIASGVGAVALQSVRLEDDVKIMAHRGSSKAAPENTMAAFTKAIEEGADWVELDVQETADGEVVVLHDSDFMKLAGRDLKIWDAALDDLNDIDVGSWFAPQFEDERVPTLAEVLDVCKGKIRVNIELKYYGHDERLEQRVAEIVERSEMSADVMVMSLKMDGVKKMKSIRPDWKVGLLLSVYAGNLDKVEADFLAINARFADRRLIKAAHESGREVYVWTVNDAPTMSAMISRGVDGLLTDKPALAQSVLRQRDQMGAAERLLLQLAGILGTVPEIDEQ